MNLSRRDFLKASGGLTFAFTFGGLVADADAQAAKTINAWVRIAPDGTVTILSTGAEMGQGSMTSLPLILAEELDADWSKVKIEWAPADPTVYGYTFQNAKAMDSAVAELTAISGQKPVITKARKAIANFKLRENMAIGCMATLRGERMYEFLDRLLNLALPRVRDFRGVSDRAFDGRGNYSLGVREQIIFPEIDIDKIDKVRGLTVSIVTTAKTDAEGKALLRALGMPFRA